MSNYSGSIRQVFSVFLNPFVTIMSVLLYKKLSNKSECGFGQVYTMNIREHMLAYFIVCQKI